MLSLAKLGRGEAPGYWAGRGAELLGLDGEVTPEALREILAGTAPDGSMLGAGNRTVPGFHLTCSVQKSVSVLAALRPGAVGTDRRRLRDRRCLVDRLAGEQRLLQPTRPQRWHREAESIGFDRASLDRLLDRPWRVLVLDDEIPNALSPKGLTHQKSTFTRLEALRDLAERATDGATIDEVDRVGESSGGGEGGDSRNETLGPRLTAHPPGLPAVAVPSRVELSGLAT